MKPMEIRVQQIRLSVLLVGWKLSWFVRCTLANRVLAGGSRVF